MIGPKFVKLERAENTSTLIVSFSAMAGSADSPSFSFGDVMQGLATGKLFLADPHCAIYQMGVPNVGADFWEIAEYISGVQEQEGITRTIMIGNSAGGFAALVLGSILGVDAIHAFNPPTLLSSELLTHDRELFGRLQKITGRGRCTYDLADFLRREMSLSTEAFVYYSRGDAIDRERTLLLKDITGVTLAGYLYPGHDLARYLARQGTITRILEASLESERDLVPSIIRESQFRTLLSFIRNMSRRTYAKLRNRSEKNVSTVPHTLPESSLHRPPPRLGIATQ